MFNAELNSSYRDKKVLDRPAQQRKNNHKIGLKMMVKKFGLCLEEYLDVQLSKLDFS